MKILFDQGDSEDFNFRSFVLGALRGCLIVVLVYALVWTFTSMSGTASLLPGAPNFVCMVIFAASYVHAHGRINCLKDKSTCRMNREKRRDKSAGW